MNHCNSRPATRSDRIILAHVLVLTLMTTLVNAAAIAPATFGGVRTVYTFAILTLLTASGEPIVRTLARRRMPLGIAGVQDRQMLRLHGFACMLAAGVSTVCALVASL